MKANTHIKVRYAETDKMGVVYYAQYYVWFEVGRTELLEQAGMPYSVMEHDGLFLPVLRSSAEYHRPARYGQTLDLETDFYRCRGFKLYIAYRLYHGATLLATGQTVHALLDASWKPMYPSVEIQKLFK